MRPAAGPILRRAGLLLEMACLLSVVALGDDRRVVAGIRLRPVLIAGVVLGFLLWAFSQFLMLTRDRQARPRD
jgi:hypothetical protein